MNRLPQIARMVSGLGLVVLMAFGLGSRPGADGPVLITSETPVTSLAEVFAGEAESSGPPTIIYADTAPPTRHQAALLGGGGRRGAQVTLITPGEQPTLSVLAPHAPVAMRRASITVTVRGDAGASIPLVVRHPAGTADTFAIALGATGTVTTAIGVEPTRAGANRWTVHAGTATAVVHAWVRPDSPVRVLVLSGPPTWESRYLIRALESSGAVVSVTQSLGRAKEVATEGVTAPSTLDEYDAYDVVAVIGDAEGVPGDVLSRWVDERGGGLLVAGASLSHPSFRAWSLAAIEAPAANTAEAPVMIPAMTSAPIEAEAIQWSGPVELVPLPNAPIASKARWLPQSNPGVPIAWAGGSAAAPDRVYAAAGWFGRGRIVSSGLETWPWAMEGGLVEEHSRHWESVVEWLAGGLRDEPTLAASVGAPYLAWNGKLQGSDVAQTHIHFVPVGPGEHVLRDDPRLGAIIAGGGERLSWTQAALDIGGEGATVLPRSEGDQGQSGRRLPTSPWMGWAAFLLLAASQLVAWTARRIEGLA